MIQVVVQQINANQVMDIVRELRLRGIQQGQDFDFAYYQASWTTEDGVTPSQTVFSFHTEKYATLFALQYGGTNVY